jgi:hypothetical protein
MNEMHYKKYIARVKNQDKFLGKRCDGGYLITSNVQKAIWCMNPGELMDTINDAKVIFNNEIDFEVISVSIIY